jgi:hypothetical protein
MFGYSMTTLGTYETHARPPDFSPHTYSPESILHSGWSAKHATLNATRVLLAPQGHAQKQFRVVRDEPMSESPILLLLLFQRSYWASLVLLLFPV